MGVSLSAICGLTAIRAQTTNETLLSFIKYSPLPHPPPCVSCSLHGGPFYERLNGMTTLHLPASGYATFPAVDISTTSFTFAIWVYHIYNGNTQVILADWSAPHKFMWRVYSGDNHAFNIRSSAGNEILPGGSFGWAGPWHHMCVCVCVCVCVSMCLCVYVSMCIWIYVAVYCFILTYHHRIV